MDEGKIDILGVKFASSSRKEIENKIKTRLLSKKRCVIFTPNPEMLLIARKDIEFGRTLNSADILLPDGIGVILASRLLRTPLAERIAGIDIGEFIASEASKSSLKIFLLGSRPGVAERSAERLSKRYKGLEVCGSHHGYFDKQGKENQEILNKISKCSPDILFVCFGCPAQERWIAENQEKLPNVCLFAGLGGSLDVWSGDTSRAPKILQKCGMEWLWRTLKEPKRFKKLIKIPHFFFFAAKQNKQIIKKTALL